MCVQNYTGVPFAFNMKKFLSLEIFYTHAVTDVTDVTDKYQVCRNSVSTTRLTLTFINT